MSLRRIADASAAPTSASIGDGQPLKEPEELSLHRGFDRLRVRSGRIPIDAVPLTDVPESGPAPRSRPPRWGAESRRRIARRQPAYLGARWPWSRARIVECRPSAPTSKSPCTLRPLSSSSVTRHHRPAEADGTRAEAQALASERRQQHVQQLRPMQHHKRGGNRRNTSAGDGREEGSIGGAEHAGPRRQPCRAWRRRGQADRAHAARSPRSRCRQPTSGFRWRPRIPRMPRPRV